MPERNDALRNNLSQSSELTITVTGRRSGREISIPVWFVLEGDKLYLLPVKGSDSQWYKNVLNHPAIRIDAGGAAAELQAVPIIEPAQVSSVVEKFRGKYGRGDVRKYYSKLDVAVSAEI
jgi:deazaflavin-dependent oxidoreductase (nitroreductase family)